MTTFRLGEILIKKGLITDPQLSQALEIQKHEKKKIGDILLSLGFIDEENISKALAEQLEMPYYSTENPELLKPKEDQSLQDLVPASFAKNNFVLPLTRHKNLLTCAIFDPLDFSMLDELRIITNCEITLVIATRSTLKTAIQDFYFLKDDISEDIPTEKSKESEPHEQKKLSNLEMVIPEVIDKKNISDIANLSEQEEEAITKLVDLIISQAIEERATDIHLEPAEDRINLRFRVDGKLYDIPPPSHHLFIPIISRIKLLSKLNVSERRFPQEGVISLNFKKTPIEIRVSSIPTIWGEKIVMKILNKNTVPLDLLSLGFDQSQIIAIKKFFLNPYGLFLVTGPLGSGTTTTLYSLLKELVDPEKNIMTIEDPVEFKFNGINQIAVNSPIGLTSSRILKSTLKQDPDIILINDIKDSETAILSINAVMAGKIILSSLTTNDASSALTRLMDLGIHGYQINSIPIMIVSQRLARRLCPECKEPYKPETDNKIEAALKSKQIYRPKGCDDCKGTGFKGMVVIAEILSVDKEIRALISNGASQDIIRDTARKNGMTTVFESGIKLIDNGVTSFNEICRITANIS